MGVSLGSLLYMFPQEASALVGIMLFMLASTHPRFTPRAGVATLAFLAFLASLAYLLWAPGALGPLGSSLGSHVTKLAIALTFAASAGLCYVVCPSGPGSLLASFQILGAMFLMSSTDWVFVFLAIELVSLASYCLVGLPGSPRSVEGAVKYFAAGALSSCFLLFGVLVLFSWEGDASFGKIRRAHV